MLWGSDEVTVSIVAYPTRGRNSPAPPSLLLRVRSERGYSKGRSHCSLLEETATRLRDVDDLFHRLTVCNQRPRMHGVWQRFCRPLPALSLAPPLL